MYSLNSFLKRASSLLAAVVLAGTAQAATLYAGDVTLTTADPTQQGRLFRSGAPSDWTAVSSFPGVSATGSIFRYTTIELDLGALQAGYQSFASYLQINVDDPLASVFVSAYAGSYDPLNKSLNYLGDAGFSGNSFGNPNFFQLFVPEDTQLVLVINTVVAGGTAGLNQPINILVEAFTDVDYTDPVEVPLPGSLALAGIALVALGARRPRRAQANVAA